MKRDKIIGVIFIALGILVALTPCVIAPTCGPMENGMFMKCHWMGRAVMGSGVMMAILGCAYFYVCSSNVKFAFGFSSFIVGIYTLLLPAYLIGGCMNKEMMCQAKTMPTVYVFAGIYSLVGIAAMILNRRKDASCRCE